MQRKGLLELHLDVSMSTNCRKKRRSRLSHKHRYGSGNVIHECSGVNADHAPLSNKGLAGPYSPTALTKTHTCACLWKPCLQKQLRWHTGICPLHCWLARRNRFGTQTSVLSKVAEPSSQASHSFLLPSLCNSTGHYARWDPRYRDHTVSGHPVGSWGV